MPTEKTQPFCPCSRAVNWTGKGLIGYADDTNIMKGRKVLFVKYMKSRERELKKQLNISAKKRKENNNVMYV